MSKVTPAKIREIIRLRTEEKIPFWQIGQKVGLAESTVHRIWHENKPSEIEPSTEARILDLYTRGLTPTEISDKLHYPVASIRAVLINAGLEDFADGGVTIAFARAHWGEWVFKKRNRRRRTEYGYRIVYVGEKKSLRTPTQWKGKWM